MLEVFRESGFPVALKAALSHSTTRIKVYAAPLPPLAADVEYRMALSSRDSRQPLSAQSRSASASIRSRRS